MTAFLVALWALITSGKLAVAVGSVASVIATVWTTARTLGVFRSARAAELERAGLQLWQAWRAVENWKHAMAAKGTPLPSGGALAKALELAPGAVRLAGLTWSPKYAALARELFSLWSTRWKGLNGVIPGGEYPPK